MTDRAISSGKLKDGEHREQSRVRSIKPRTLTLIFSLVWIFSVICSAYKFNNPLGVFLAPLVLREFFPAITELVPPLPRWLIFSATIIEAMAIVLLGILSWRRNSRTMAWWFSGAAFLSAIPTLVERGKPPTEWNPYVSPWVFFFVVSSVLWMLAFRVRLSMKNGEISRAGSGMLIGCCCFLVVLTWLAKDPVVGEVFRYCEGLAVVNIDGRFGYVDETKRIVIKPRFTEALDFSEGLAAVAIDRNGDRWRKGYINRSGTIVIESQEFDEAASFSEGLARVRVRGKFGFIDKGGSVRINPQFDGALAFSQGLAAVKIGELWGYIDASGKLVHQPVFADAKFFTEGLAAVAIEKNTSNRQPSVSHKYGFIDKDGNVVIAAEFERADPFQAGLAKVKFKGKYGCIDKSGAFVINPTFDAVDEFSDGLAAVSFDRKWGYISKGGRIEIPLKFDFAKRFSHGKAFVRLPGGKSGYIDKQGRFSPVGRSFYDQMADFRVAIRSRVYPPGVSTPQ